MQLRIALQFLHLDNMSKRFFNSSSNSNSALHLNKVGVESHVTKAAASADHRKTKGAYDNQRTKIECNASDPTYEAKWPSLSTSVSSRVHRKGRQRTRNDLDLNLQQGQDEQLGDSLPEDEAISELDSASHPSPFVTAAYPRASALAAKGSRDDNLVPDNVSAGRYGKCRPKTRIDLGTQFEQRSNERSGLDGMQEDESPFRLNSARQGNNPSPPTRGGKLSWRSSPWSQQQLQTNPEPWIGAKLSVDNRPFDICIKKGRNQSALNSTLPCDNISKCIEFDPSMEGNGIILRPGMVLLKSYIPLSIQVDIALRCRELGIGKGGFYRPGFKDGAKLSLRMMCFGLDWDPQTKKYGERRNYDDAIPPDIPPDFNMLVRKALLDSQEVIKQQSRRSDVDEILPIMNPDICIVNFYTRNGRLGLHQDRDESRGSISRGLPVVSFSIGDSAEFLYGEKRDVDKAERVLLESGDVLIFGGNSRQIFHGVASVVSKTAPKALVKQAKLCPGRLNLTFRKY